MVRIWNLLARSTHRLGRLYRVRRRIPLFQPILPGTRPWDRVVACGGALLAIAATGLLCRSLLVSLTEAPVLIAPVGASAVLLFAVPASPLAQPWPIVGGNTLSALVGVTVAAAVPDPMLAGALAVALAIAVMSLTRSLHPPGGAAALTAVLGGPAVAAAGYGFAFVPVATNSLLLVAAGWLFHRVSRHSYPHRTKIHDRPTGIVPSDIEDAIDDLGEALDVSRDDLGALLHRAELHAMERLRPDILCRDVMVRGAAPVGAETGCRVASGLLAGQPLANLPVVDGQGRVVGFVGHRQLAGRVGQVAELMVPAATEGPDAPALRLLGHLCDGRTDQVAIVDGMGKLLGVVTRADLLVVLARTVLRNKGDTTQAKGKAADPMGGPTDPPPSEPGPISRCSFSGRQSNPAVPDRS